MATQVEALLPGNPLAKAEDHGKVIRDEPVGEEEEEEEEQRGVADSSAGLGGTTGGGEQTSRQAAEPQEDVDGCDSGDKPSEEGVKDGGVRKEFTEAPPPKVNPWTRKMNTVTVVSVNGQAHTGMYPEHGLLLPVSALHWMFSIKKIRQSTSK